MQRGEAPREGKTKLHFFISRLSRHAHSAVTSHILLLWLLVLVFVVGCGFLLGRSVPKSVSAISQEGASDRKTHLLRHLRFPGILFAIGFLLFLGLYISLIFYKEDFAYYDDDQLIDFSLQGKTFAPPVWPGSGRFFPLGLQEFNLLRYITISPAGYHSLVTAQLLILIVVLFLALSELKVRYRILTLSAVMLAPSFVIVFSGLVYPERNVLFLLAVMVLCLQRHSKTGDPAYFLGCLVATQFALYYKETVVVFIATYAGARLLLEYHIGVRRGHYPWRELARKGALSLGMLAVSGIYTAFFLIALLPQRSFSYIASTHESVGSTLLAYLLIDCIPFVLTVIVILRLGRFLVSKGDLDPLWDSLALAACVVFACTVGLRLYSGYYLAPVDFVALLYLGRLAAAWISKPSWVRRFVAAGVYLCIVSQSVAYSSFRMVEKKNTIALKSRFADFLQVYLPTVDGKTVELFFPYTNGYRLMELSAYLRYRGFQLSGQRDTPSEPEPSLLVEGREHFDGSRCVGYRDYSCTHRESPGAGALIVVLPDDDASMGSVQNIGKDSTLLLSAQASAKWTRPDSWFRLLHGISPMFPHSELPGHWLQLHVFKKVPYANVGDTGDGPSAAHVPAFAL